VIHIDERYAYVCGVVSGMAKLAGWEKVKFEDYYRHVVVEHQDRAAYLILAGPGQYTVDVYAPIDASNPLCVTHTADLDAALEMLKRALS
jgi:hypothetical protein